MTYTYLLDFMGEQRVDMVLRSDGAFVLTYGNDEDSVAYRSWIAEGNEPGEAVPFPTFPSVVTAAQAKIALYNAGLLNQVRAAVAAHPYELVRIWFEDARDWERGNPYVQALGVELGLTDEQIDALFIAAAQII